MSDVSGPTRTRRLWVSALVGAAAFLGCAAANATHASASAPSTSPAAAEAGQPPLTPLDQPGLEMGEYPIDGASSVVDGDTIRVRGLKASLRLLAIDTEETFKHDKERAAFAAGWDTYRERMRNGSPRPVKMPTPLGEEAKHFAQAFFDGASSVRLERDHPGELRDYYARYLAYVFVLKGSKWVNFNVESVRAGMSPYFTKYGRSRRFHDDFVRAQAEAQAANRGIWDPAKQHYGDYPERLAWWNARAEVVRQFEQRATDNPEEFVALTRWDAMLRLEQRLGQKTAVLGAVGEIRRSEKGPIIVKLSRSRGNDFDVVFFDKDVFLASNLENSKGEFVQVRGPISKYFEKYRQRERLQIIVNLPGQVLFAGTAKSTPATEERPPRAAGAEEDEAD